MAEPPTLTWEEYLRLPEDPRVEYVDGRLLVNPSPSRQHQTTTLRLTLAIEAALPPTHGVVPSWAWKPGQDEFITDVLVHDVAGANAGSDARFTGIPDLVVEVLSCGDDLVRKSAKYAAAGLPRFWTVDLRDERLDAYALLDGVLTPTAALGRGDVADLDAGVAVVHVDVDALLR